MRKIELDYRKCIEEDIDKALDQFVNKEIDEINISNIHPAIFERRYGMEIDNENGFDMDWWGSMDYNNCSINVFGCCRYGYIRIEVDNIEL